MSCKHCKRDIEDLLKYSLDDKVLCKKCNICKQCAKKKYSVDNKCLNCCDICKRCKKLVIKNNWPEDIIKFGKCGKCNNICSICDKHINIENMFYKKRNNKFCELCFREKYESKDDNKKYTIISKKTEDGNKFLGWRKTHDYINCNLCKKTYWKYINSGNLTCKKCNSVTPKKIMRNPSTNNEYYKEQLINKKITWKLECKRKKCFNCFNSIWINIDNIKSGEQYYCSKCYPIRSPNNNDKKLKYDKDKQMWVAYRIKIKCTKCSKNKWIYTKDNNNNICKSCQKN